MHIDRHLVARHRLRSGLSLPELMIASSILALMLAALGSLASAVDSGHEYCHGRSVATQHARVAMQRITRNLNGAHASREFPGFISFQETIGLYSFPETLVIWQPIGNPANTGGLPLIGELVVYCPNPANPAELWEITARDDTRSAPALSDTAGWATLLTHFKTGSGPQRVELTNLLRTANVGSGSDTPQLRAAVRFEVTLRPTDAELASFANGDKSWDDIAWVQGIYGNTTGLRQSWCSVELQLLPSNWQATQDPSGISSIPFFGSGAVYYQVSQ